MKSKSVYVLGSINTDLAIVSNRMPSQGETINGYDFAQNLGGKGCNQAVSCSEFGADTHLIGCVGRDYFGQFAFNRLLDRKVSSQHVSFIETESTGVAIVIRSDGDNRIILDQGANGHLSIEQIDKALQDAKEGDVFLSQFEVPMNLVDYGLKKSKEKGLFTVVNPAPAVYLEDEMYRWIDCLIINQTEAHELTDVLPATIDEAKAAADIILAKGAHSVIITCGGEGSYYLDRDGLEHKQLSFPITSIDSTGAGDAFIGVYIAALTQEYSVGEALRFASAAGAYACTRKGAQEDVPNKEELIKFIGGM